MKHTIAIVAALAAAGAPATTALIAQGHAGHDMSVHAALAGAIADPGRSEASRARDAYRHPMETLGFFGVKPGDRVVELLPGGGWYTEILAPYLAARGKLYDAMPAGAGQDRFRAKVAATPSWAKVAVVDLPAPAAQVPDGSVDVVLTFRNIHNLTIPGKGEDARVLASAFRMLKPGGTLGVVEHRLPESMDTALEARSGYLKVSTVRRIVEAAGFEYVGASEVNANPKDTHDYPKGVWTLPPTYTEGDKDRARYTAIGESDRMTLKFRKPLK
ncbi:MAG: methyltransferase [Sphingomonas sanxanigenens]|uniref:Methyltransferase n=1 Tax=Sphingomonas sanxanigenens TaxID=397260 RepID=A0A2W5AB02_9SPHN|nr:MAG: methyltransferase [Sphingomonas sanxanigenens]